MQPRTQLGVCFLVAVLAAASMWFYVDRILIGYQLADATAHQRPRGNLSDLYPRWLGARELLRNRRNPYGDDITLEIQKGYYGRALDPGRPDDPKDQQGFAYPVYVVFLLAPLIGLPFHQVQILFHWLLLGLTAGSVCLWLRALRWRISPLAIAIAVALTLGSVPAVQGIKLQQLSLLDAGLLAATSASVASGYLFAGGVLLALATIKPQLAWALAAWLLLWAASEWHTRRKFILGFSLTMAVLVGASQAILPGWVRMFAGALADYHRYAQNQSVLDELMPWGFAGKILAGVAAVATACLVWRLRRARSESAAFGRALAVVMALTLLVVPMYRPYNDVLLLPAILVLARDWRMLMRSRGLRLGCFTTGLALSWQWIASMSLTGIYLLVSPANALVGWKWPFFTTFALPVLIFLLMLLDVHTSTKIIEK